MTWLRAFLGLAGAGALFLPVWPDPPLRADPFVANVQMHSVVLACILGSPARITATVRPVDGSAPPREKKAERPRRRHELCFEGLQPDTRYRFEVRDGAGGRLGEGSFRTAPPPGTGRVRFCVVGDSGGQPWWTWLQDTPALWLPARLDWLPVREEVARIGEAMAREAPDLWFHVGDVVYPWGMHRHYRAGFFRPFADLLTRAPCYAVLGNHDVVLDQGRPLLRNLVLPTNPVSGDERFWSVSFGPIRVVGLDLNHEVTAADPALRVLERELAGSREPWRVVITHFPYRSSSRQGDRLDLVEHLLPALVRSKVDLVFAGHDHNYQRFGDPRAVDPADRMVLVVTGGGGKSLYELKEDPRVQARRKGYHFCRVDVDPRSLRLSAIDPDGRVFDTLELHKP